jgi:transcriptional regulator with XRE-family HTH domain
LSSSLKIPTPSFGEAVRFLRETMGLTQEEVSGKGGLHVTHISDLEQGRGNPTHQTIEGLARGLELPSAYILVLEDIFERRRARTRR